MLPRWRFLNFFPNLDPLGQKSTSNHKIQHKGTPLNKDCMY